MKIKETMHQRVAVLSLKGSLMGPPETLKLTDDISQLIRDGVTRVILDLRHVNWINSLGVGAIVKSLTLLQKEEGLLYLVGMTDKVKSVFAITQLIKLFSVHDDLKKAIDELNSR